MIFKHPKLIVVIVFVPFPDFLIPFWVLSKAHQPKDAFRSTNGPLTITLILIIITIKESMCVLKFSCRRTDGRRVTSTKSRISRRFALIVAHGIISHRMYRINNNTHPPTKRAALTLENCYLYHPLFLHSSSFHHFMTRS